MTRLLRRSFRLGCAAVLFASGCTSSTRVVVVERPVEPAPSSSALPGPSAATLEARLRRFLDEAVAARPVDLLLAGDRFVVLTPVTLVEVTSLRARGDIRLMRLEVPGDCAGPCRRTLGDAFATLAADLDAGSPMRVTAPSPLEEWPTLQVEGSGRTWRASFDAQGIGLFVIELVAGTL